MIRANAIHSTSYCGSHRSVTNRRGRHPSARAAPDGTSSARRCPPRRWGRRSICTAGASISSTHTTNARSRRAKQPTTRPSCGIGCTRVGRVPRHQDVEIVGQPWCSSVSCARPRTGGQSVWRSWRTTTDRHWEWFDDDIDDAASGFERLHAAANSLGGGPPPALLTRSTSTRRRPRCADRSCGRFINWPAASCRGRASTSNHRCVTGRRPASATIFINHSPERICSLSWSALLFTDTLTGKKVAFAPRDPGRAGIYWCGPTVYDHPHLGHARSVLGYDILHRYLEWRGYEVTLVSNITDIDDNIIKRAAREGAPSTKSRRSTTSGPTSIRWTASVSPRPICAPCATEYVPQMIDVIASLIDRGYAYAVEGSGVYFDADRLDDGVLVHLNAHDLREGRSRGRCSNDERRSARLRAMEVGQLGRAAVTLGAGPAGWHRVCRDGTADRSGSDIRRRRRRSAFSRRE